MPTTASARRARVGLLLPGTCSPGRAARVREEPAVGGDHARITRTLQFYFGRLTDGEAYFLLAGAKLGVFGAENEHETMIGDADWAHMVTDTRGKLEAAGIVGEPAVDAQY